MNNINKPDKEKAILEVIAERDSLKEQLQKEQHKNEVYIHGLLEMEKIVAGAAYCIDQEKEKTRKAESNKAEAVRIAVDYVNGDCNYCTNEYGDVRKCAGCLTLLNVQALERLTGKKWEELRG